MVELIGDVCIPTDFVFPSRTGAEIAAITAAEAGLTYLNSTTSKLNFWNGAAWVIITSP